MSIEKYTNGAFVPDYTPTMEIHFGHHLIKLNYMFAPLVIGSYVSPQHNSSTHNERLCKLNYKKIAIAD